MDAARERPQFLDRALELGVDLGQQRVERLRIGAGLVAGEPDREPQAEQRLLGTVVEVALDPSPLGVGRVDQPHARLADLVQARAQLGLQARVLQRQLRGGGHRPEQLRILQQRGVIDERRERLLALPQHRDAAVLVVLGQLHRVSRRRPRRPARSGNQKATRSEGSPSVRASSSRSPPGSGAEPSSTIRSATTERCWRVRSMPIRNPTGIRPNE